MIVKCERCQTRFKIPDEKVTEKGVKVRCTKCQNTFRVAREPASDPSALVAAPEPSGQVDPFQDFGVAPDPKGVEITRPGFYGAGVEATRPLPAASSWNDVDIDVDEEGNEEPTRTLTLPVGVYPPALAGGQPSPESLSGEDPFSDFMTAPATAPLTSDFDLGAEEVGAAPPRAPTPAAPPRAMSPPPAPPRAPVPAVAVPVASAAVRAPVPPSAPPPAPRAESLLRAASAPTSAPAGASPLGPLRTASAPAPVAVEEEDPFASLDLDAPSPVAPPPVEEPGSTVQDTVPTENLGDLFDFSGGASGEEGLGATDTGRAALLGHEPPAEPPGVSLLGDLPALDASDAPTGMWRDVVDLQDVPASAGPAVSVAKPSARPEDVGIPQRSGSSRARKVTGLVANVAIATVLVVGLGAVGHVYLREGRLDLSALSPERLRALVTPTASRPLQARDVSNGLYETRDGQQLFLVRGEVRSTATSASRVRVRAALFDGDQRVRSTEGLAGALPTPEDLFGLSTAESVSALRQRLDAAATVVQPGGAVPFLVLFHEYPADLASFRLEVTLELAPASAPPAPKAE
ncbi:zinc-ribbon domain-containing protein [Corallococcus sp. M34]|uniref:zinc-ribbon domain-containing protein n=1 Tax=Citreicoccus inhibens TaxID=2849499 RepID=UPI001C2275E0|nr:zinc-ribbon domain-containing protein [Citreicoccus inhibens]MBU8896018.1 zinc-ribbon domain-containing protein [Citreicoccus inhibens]